MSCGLLRLGQDSRENRRCGAREEGRGCINGVNLLEKNLRTLMFLSA